MYGYKISPAALVNLDDPTAGASGAQTNRKGRQAIAASAYTPSEKRSMDAYLCFVI
jgi:hypothetical protein